MKQKMIVSVLLAICLSSGVMAQLPSAKPYTWAYSAKKLPSGNYELHLTMSLNAPWHTYSQSTPDGGPVATKFTFAKNPLYSFAGAVKENGKLLQKNEKVFGVDVKYFEGKVDFVQVVSVKARARTNVSGSVEFMVCNDRQCLAPTTENFSIALN